MMGGAADDIGADACADLAGFKKSWYLAWKLTVHKRRPICAAGLVLFCGRVGLESYLSKRETAACLKCETLGFLPNPGCLFQKIVRPKVPEYGISPPLG